MATLLGEDYVDEPLDWRLMDEAEPLSAALQPLGGALTGALQPPPEPRKALDVSKGAPSALTQPEPRQDSGGIGALKEAMAQARQNRMGAELGMAGETIANAFVPQKSSGFWQRQLEGADRPVQELQAQQKMQNEGLDRTLKQRALENDVAGLDLKKQQMEFERLGQGEKTKRLAAETAKIQAEVALKARQNDKDSPESHSLQDALAKTPYGMAQGGINALRNLSAAQLLQGVSVAKDTAAMDKTLDWAKFHQGVTEKALDRTAAQERANTIATGKATTEAGKATSANRLLEAADYTREGADFDIKPEEAKDFRAGEVVYKNATNMLAEMEKIRKGSGYSGGKLLPRDRARLGVLKNKLLGAINKSEKFGTLDAGSLTVLEPIIPNADDFLDATFDGKLQQLRDSINDGFQNQATSLGYRPKKKGSGAPPPPPPTTPAGAATKFVDPESGETVYFDENGDEVE